MIVLALFALLMALVAAVIVRGILMREPPRRHRPF